MRAREEDLALLRTVVGGKRGPIEAALELAPEQVLEFLGFAQRHQLAGYVYYRLRSLGLEQSLPPGPRARAQAVYLAQWRRNELLVRDLAEIQGALAGAGVDAMMLKGPLLVERLFGHVGARPFGDLDILLRSERDLVAAERAMVSLGYRRHFGLLLGRRISKLFTHHFAYARGASMVELHWAIQRHVTYRIDDERLWCGSREATFRGRLYRVPDPRDEILVHALGVFTDLQVGRLVLRPLLDLRLLLEEADPTIDWSEFFAQRGRERLRAIVVFVLDLALRTLGGPEAVPALARFLAREAGASPERSEQALRIALSSRRTSVGQKLTAFRLYDTWLPVAVGWWALSLPWRVVVYHEGRPRPAARPASVGTA